MRKDLHQPARRRLGACYRQDLFGGILGANQDGPSMEKLQREGLYIKKKMINEQNKENAHPFLCESSWNPTGRIQSFLLYLSTMLYIQGHRMDLITLL